MAEPTDPPATNPDQDQDPVVEPVAAVEPPPWGDDFDPQRAWSTIQKQRDEAKELRAKARQADDALTRLKEIEDADKTELQKLEERVAEFEQREQQWQTEKRDTALRLAVAEKAQELGIVSPRLALAALKLEGADVEWSDGGEPTNLDSLLSDLLEREPGLRGTPAPRKPGNVNAADGVKDVPPPALTEEELQMAARFGKTPEEYAALKEVKSYADFQQLKRS